jgi:hypothetical protein
MKTNPDPDPEDPLLEAVLRDDRWQAANAAGKAQALGVFRARQRVRRWSRWAGGLAALAVAAACAAHWWAGPVAPAPPRLAEKAPAPPARPEKSIYLTDGQLLALFPEGSCFLAEVDGKKKLVFFDPKVEREYVSDAGGQPSIAP